MVMCDLYTYFNLLNLERSRIVQPKLSGHNRGAAVEADAIEEQLKRTI